MKQAGGFSLTETMISLALGVVISGAIIQILVSSSVTSKLNEAVSQVQSAGRFISSRLTTELNQIGRYDQITSNVDDSVDLVSEAAYLQNHPIVLPGDFNNRNTFGSTQGANGANDNLVVNVLSAQDCTGSRHGYTEEFHVVNHYFVSGSTLKCTGYDGRVLRGLLPQTVAPRTITLLDNVIGFQLQYGVSDPIGATLGQAVTYVSAAELADYRDLNQQVVALRWGILLESYQNEVQLDTAPTISLLNEPAPKLTDDHYYQAFTKTLSLRNMKNVVRSAQ